MVDSSPSPARLSHRLPVRKKLLFCAAVFFAALGVAELSARLLGIGSRGEVAHYITNWKVRWSDDFYRIDPFSRPGINADGVRDREHSVDNPENLLRIACLGDSVTFGYRLRYSDSYPAILEERLAASGQRAEVFNVALPGWATHQQRIAYDLIARQYRPDYVILGFCLNDVGEMQNNLSQTAPAVAWLVEHSNLVRGLLRAEAREIGRVEELFETPASPQVEHGWQLCREEIRGIAHDVERDGGKLVLVVFPFRFQVEPNAPPPIAQRRLIDIAGGLGLETIDVLPALRELGPEAFVDYDHLSRAGAELVAAEILRSGKIARDETQGDAAARAPSSRPTEPVAPEHHSGISNNPR